jgi:hypothetical protein
MVMEKVVVLPLPDWACVGEDECLRLLDGNINGLEHGDGESGGFTCTRPGIMSMNWSMVMEKVLPNNPDQTGHAWARMSAWSVDRWVFQ